MLNDEVRTNQKTLDIPVCRVNRPGLNLNQQVQGRAGGWARGAQKLKIIKLLKKMTISM
jgi:hypothetical protein